MDHPEDRLVNEKKTKFWPQFARNMVVGTCVSGFWYGTHNIIHGFWLPTIITNTVTFFVCRYWLFREGNT
jgi:hypothetical protein